MSEVYLLSHLRGKKHQQALSEIPAAKGTVEDKVSMVWDRQWYSVIIFNLGVIGWYSVIFGTHRVIFGNIRESSSALSTLWIIPSNRHEPLGVFGRPSVIIGIYICRPLGFFVFLQTNLALQIFLFSQDTISLQYIKEMPSDKADQTEKADQERQKALRKRAKKLRTRMAAKWVVVFQKSQSRLFLGKIFQYNKRHCGSSLLQN